MRLDKFLKVSRLIKRRTVAKDACENERVIINGKIAKPGTEVKEGDIIEILFATKSIKAKVVSIKEHALKNDADSMYELMTSDELKDSDE